MTVGSLYCLLIFLAQLSTLVVMNGIESDLRNFSSLRLKPNQHAAAAAASLVC